jgi:acetoin utilization deacetylase AcuC-like enzyme
MLLPDATGWCIFNDLAVAAKAAQRDTGLGQVLMVDLDVHQGDGSATIFADDPSVYTFSMHCKDQSFPTVYQKSDLDIELPAGTEDEEYLRVRWWGGVHTLVGAGDCIAARGAYLLVANHSTCPELG